MFWVLGFLFLFLFLFAVVHSAAINILYLGIICLVMWYGYFHLYKIMPNYILQWLYQFIPLGTIWITFVSRGNISYHISHLVLANFILFNFVNPVAVKWYIITVSHKNTTIFLTFVLLYKNFYSFSLVALKVSLDHCCWALWLWCAWYSFCLFVFPSCFFCWGC